MNHCSIFPHIDIDIDRYIYHAPSLSYYMITKHHLAIFIYPYHIHITTIRTSSDHLTAGPAAIAAPQRSATCSLRPGPTAGGGVDFSWDFKWISEESMGYHGKFTEIRGISWGLTSILLLILSNV